MGAGQARHLACLTRRRALTAGRGFIPSRASRRWEGGSGPSGGHRRLAPYTNLLATAPFREERTRAEAGAEDSPWTRGSGSSVAAAGLVRRGGTRRPAAGPARQARPRRRRPSAPRLQRRGRQPPPRPGLRLLSPRRQDREVSRNLDGADEEGSRRAALPDRRAVDEGG